MRKREPGTKKWVMPVLLGAAFVLITASGIWVRQNVLFMVPLYVSLVVATMNARVSRYAKLIGGINSVFYAAVFIYYGLYGNAMNALLVSCTLQLITFFRWKKRPWGNSTVFRKMSGKLRAAVALGFCVLSASVFLALRGLGSEYQLVDTLSTGVGLLAAFLNMLACVEYTWVMLPNDIVTIVTYSTMAVKNPEQLPYVVYSLYGFLCGCMAFVRVRQLYAEQQAARATLPPQEDAPEEQDMQKM